jgi:hypothetical protein
MKDEGGRMKNAGQASLSSFILPPSSFHSEIHHDIRPLLVIMALAGEGSAKY